MYHRKEKLLFICLSKIQLNLISFQLQPILLQVCCCCFWIALRSWQTDIRDIWRHGNVFDFMFRQQMYYKYILVTDRRTDASMLPDQRKRCLHELLLKTKPNKMPHSLLHNIWKSQFFLWTNIHNFRKKSKMDASSAQKHRTKPLPNSPAHLRAEKRGAEPHSSVSWLLWVCWGLF